MFLMCILYLVTASLLRAIKSLETADNLRNRLMVEISGLRPITLNDPSPFANGHDLREAAEQLEVTFLSEMLKSAGFGKSRESFGGGVGEDQFGSFLRQAQAQEMVKSGGIGLAEKLFDALKLRADE
jgi:Rod binding domain-containing protein